MKISTGSDGIVNGDSNETVTGVAGGGTNALSDGQLATDTFIRERGGIAFDRHGNLFFSGQKAAFKIDAGANGMIDGASDPEEKVYRLRLDSVVLPSDHQGGNPGDIAVLSFDSFGNLFANHMRYLIKVAPGVDGEIGGPLSGQDDSYTAVGRVPAAGTDENASTYDMGLSEGLSFDRWGNLFIKLRGVARIIKTLAGDDGEISGDAKERLVTKVAGAGIGYREYEPAANSAFLNYASELSDWGGSGSVFLADGSLLFTDINNHVLRRILPGAASAITGDEPLVHAAGSAPDEYERSLSCFPNCPPAPEGGFADSTTTDPGRFDRPNAIAVDVCRTGNIYVGDVYNHRVRLVQGVAGGRSPPATSSSLSVPEGNSGTTTASFKVWLAYPCPFPVSVNYATENQTAKADEDYVGSAGTLEFQPGETFKTVDILVNGDSSHESHETFKLHVRSVASGSEFKGVGTILDDDPVPALPVLAIPELKLPDIDLDSGQAPPSSPPELPSTSDPAHLEPIVGPPGGTTPAAPGGALAPIPSLGANAQAGLSAGPGSTSASPSFSEGLLAGSSSVNSSAGVLEVVSQPMPGVGLVGAIDTEEATSPSARHAMVSNKQAALGIWAAGAVIIFVGSIRRRFATSEEFPSLFACEVVAPALGLGR